MKWQTRSGIQIKITNKRNSDKAAAEPTIRNSQREATAINEF